MFVSQREADDQIPHLAASLAHVPICEDDQESTDEVMSKQDRVSADKDTEPIRTRAEKTIQKSSYLKDYCT